MADQVAGRPLGLLNDSLYKLADTTRGNDHNGPNGIVDVTQGNNDIGPFTNSDGQTVDVPGFTAGAGYDLASGLGTIDAGSFVPALAKAARDDNEGEGGGDN
jgi:hypothetical protein